MKILIFIFFFPFALQAQTNLSRIDGIIDGPTDNTIEFESPPGIQLTIADYDDTVYLTLKSESIFVASLCIATEKEIHVLHASAALGSITYLQNESGKWKTEEEFVWQMRETDLSKESIQKRGDYLAKSNWVANTMSMGRIGETEFIIDLKKYGEEPVYMAAGLMPESAPENIIPIPTRYAGDCADYGLVSGSPNQEYNFAPANWYKIR